MLFNQKLKPFLLFQSCCLLSVILLVAGGED